MAVERVVAYVDEAVRQELDRLAARERRSRSQIAGRILSEALDVGSGEVTRVGPSTRDAGTGGLPTAVQREDGHGTPEPPGPVSRLLGGER